MVNRRCAIVGLGRVGTAASLVFATSGLFDEIFLCGRDADKAWAEALDLTHATALMQNKCNVVGTTAANVHHCEIVVVAVGVSQAAVAGGDRTSGLAQAASMTAGVVRAMAENNPDAVFIVVTNPVEAMVFAAQRGSGLPARQVISCGTVLDSARLQNAIGKLLRVDPKNVNALVLGEHGPTAFPLLSAATVAGVPLADMMDEEEAMMVKAAILDVRREPFLVRDYKGGTSSAVSMAALAVARAIVTDADALMPVSVIPEDLPQYADICLNLPCVVGRGGVKRVVLPTLSEDEAAQLQASAGAIRATIDKIR